MSDDLVTRMDSHDILGIDAEILFQEAVDKIERLWAQLSCAESDRNKLKVLVEKELWRLFNLDSKNQSEPATLRRMAINECRSVLAILEGGANE